MGVFGIVIKKPAGPGGPYTPPEGDEVNFNFPGGYTPPEADEVDFDF